MKLDETIIYLVWEIYPFVEASLYVGCVCPVALVGELDLTWMQVIVFLMVLAGNNLVGG